MQHPVGKTLWLAWLLAGLSAWAAGIVAGCDFGGPVVSGAAPGTVLAFAQGMVLRQVVSVSPSWFVAAIAVGALGAAAGSGHGVPLGQAHHPSTGPYMFRAAAGASVGAMQWLALRRVVRSAGWWLLATVIGGAGGMAAGFEVSCTAAPLAGALGGGIAGSISGAALLRLLPTVHTGLGSRPDVC